MAVDSDQVERSIEIVVAKRAPEAQRGFGRQPNATLHGNVRKITTRIRAVKPDHLVIKIGDRNSGMSGIIEISYIYSHAGARLAFSAERDSRFDGNIFERAISQIAIQLIRLRVV